MTMLRRIPMDTTMSFRCARGPEPDMDRESGRQKVRDGQPVFRVRVVAMGEDLTEVLPVKVAGEPAGLSPDTPVRVKGLVAVPWKNDRGDTDLTFWAASIEPARPERAAS